MSVPSTYCIGVFVFKRVRKIQKSVESHQLVIHTLLQVVSIDFYFSKNVLLHKKTEFLHISGTDCEYFCHLCSFAHKQHSVEELTRENKVCVLLA